MNRVLFGLTIVLVCGCQNAAPPPVVNPVTPMAPVAPFQVQPEAAPQTPVTQTAPEKPSAQTEEAASNAKPDLATPSPAEDEKPQIAEKGSPASDSKQPLSPKEMLKVASTGVVLITVYDALGDKVGLGSGCIIGKDQILTNYHVIATAVTADLHTKGTGDELLSTAIKVVGYRALDQSNDLAVIAVEGLPETLHKFVIGDDSKLEQFDKVFAIGHPDGLKFSMSPGLVNALPKTSDLPEQLQAYLKGRTTEWIQTDAVISGGSSGGPLLNEQGEIVGINTLRVGARTALAVRSHHVNDLLPKISETIAPLPVPDADILVTKSVAQIKRGFDLEFRQFVGDIQQAAPERLQDLIRKNNPGPACLQRCQELVRQEPGSPEAEDAIRLSVHILSFGRGQISAGRNFLDEVLEQASSDHKVLPVSARLIGSLQGLSYSESLDHFLRSVINGDYPDNVKGIAGATLAIAMVGSTTEDLDGEVTELANEIKTRFGDQTFQGGKIGDLLEPVIDAQTFAIGSIAPDIVGKDIEGKEFRLSEYRGKVVVIDFWADWCPHCRNMYAHEREMVEQLKDKPFALLGVNGDEPDRAKRTIKGGAVTWRSWLDGPTGPIVEQYKIRSWPTIYVLDKDGRIQFKDVRNEELSAAVDLLLNDTPFLSTQDILPAHAEWKIHGVKSGEDPGAWRDEGFDDASWAAAAAPIGRGQVKSTLDQGPPGQRPLTTLFRTSFDLPANELPPKLLLQARYRDAVVLYLNGQEIYRDRLTATAKLDSAAVSRGTDREASGMTIAIDSSLLKPTGNRLCAELHQFSPYSAKPLFEVTIGNPPDLTVLLKDATTHQQSTICRLLSQVGESFTTTPEILTQLQTNESAEVRVRAALAAAICQQPVTANLKDDESSQMLASVISELNRVAWDSAVRADFNAAEYEEAVKMARGAYELLHSLDKGYRDSMNVVINTYGVALYRSGQFEKAQDILKESLEAKGDNPIDLAYLCMALWKDDDKAEARERRKLMQKLLNADAWKFDQLAKQAKDEVDQLLRD